MIELHAGGHTSVRGDVVSAYPTSIEGVVWVERSAEGLVTITVRMFGLVVEWDGGSDVEVSIPRVLSNRVEGLCGRYNGDRSDDFTTPAGAVVADAMTFGKSWRLDHRNVPYHSIATECAAVEPTAGCHRSDNMTDATKQAVEAAEAYCSRLVDADGLYRHCHDEIDPGPFKIACEEAFCTQRKSAGCYMFEHYEKACGRAGIVL